MFCLCRRILCMVLKYSPYSAVLWKIARKVEINYARQDNRNQSGKLILTWSSCCEIFLINK